MRETVVEWVSSWWPVFMDTVVCALESGGCYSAGIIARRHSFPRICPNNILRSNGVFVAVVGWASEGQTEAEVDLFPRSRIKLAPQEVERNLKIYIYWPKTLLNNTHFLFVYTFIYSFIYLFIYLFIYFFSPEPIEKKTNKEVSQSVSWSVSEFYS